MTAPQPAVALFSRLLGADAFGCLAGPVRGLHSCTGKGTARWHGEVTVMRGSSLLARLCSWATRLPPAGMWPITVEIVTDVSRAGEVREQWSRFVAGRVMRSRLRAVKDLLHERLGLVDFRFRLESPNQDIVWTVVGVRVLGMLPLPVAWFTQVRARESAMDGRYCFEVVAALPLAGTVVQYQGWLDVP